MFRRVLTLGIILILVVFLLKLIVVGLSKTKLAEFQPVATIFLLDISASSRGSIDKQKETILKIAKRMDSEDKALIYVVSENAYNVYNGNPHKLVDMRKSMNKYGEFDPKAYGTAYGLALKKAVGDAIEFKEAGYKPAIFILGDLENEGDVTKQINWNTLPKNMERTLKYIPDLSLTFLYAHPQKLDEVRQTLLPVMSEEKSLTMASEENVDQAVRKVLEILKR